MELKKIYRVYKVNKSGGFKSEPTLPLADLALLGLWVAWEVRCLGGTDAVAAMGKKNQVAPAAGFARFIGGSCIDAGIYVGNIKFIKRA